MLAAFSEVKRLTQGRLLLRGACRLLQPNNDCNKTALRPATREEGTHRRVLSTHYTTQGSPGNARVYWGDGGVGREVLTKIEGGDHKAYSEYS